MANRNNVDERGAAASAAPQTTSADAAKPRVWYRKSRAGAAGVVVGSAAVVAAAAIGAGAQLAGSPTATALPVDTPTATVSGVAPPSKEAQYWSKVDPAYTDMESAVQALSNASDGGNPDAMKAACQQLSKSGQELKNTLPSPDSKVTPRIQEAVDNINSAYNVCMTLGPDTSQADVNQFTDAINAARAHLKSAQQIVAANQ